MAVDAPALQRRLEELMATHKVPGAVLAVWQDGEETVFPAGVINKNTGVEVTGDTLFQIGSVSKVWTATLVMMLVDEGVLELDAPVRTYLPEFKVADPEVTEKVTLRHLLSHTSGIGGDHIIDTGRGDDVLERYVESCAELGQENELGASMSYCNTGYSILGRVIEKVTGKVWDAVLKERILVPLGLAHTNTLPEEALLFRTAAGHVAIPAGSDPQVAPVWVLPRSAGPAGLINASASDLLSFARMHLDDGQAPDGTQLLSPAAVKQMQQTQIEVPDKYTLGDRWGLGWILFDWDGHPGFGHDGSTLGQYAFMRVLPESRLAVALLTNGGQASQVYKTLVREVFSDLAGVTVPAVPGVPDTPPDLDLGLYEGTYARLNVELTLTVKEEGNSLDAVVVASGPIAEMIPEAQRRQTLDIVPVDRELFLASDDKSPAPTPMVFFDFDGDRPGRLHFGARAMTRR
jgi:CubicO group peptidase (beta-lactamase class C family)